MSVHICIIFGSNCLCFAKSISHLCQQWCGNLRMGRSPGRSALCLSLCHWDLSDGFVSIQNISKSVVMTYSSSRGRLTIQKSTERWTCALKCSASTRDSHVFDVYECCFQDSLKSDNHGCPAPFPKNESFFICSLHILIHLVISR